MFRAGSRPTVAHGAPYPVEVQAARRLWRCRCGTSKTRPFRDGRHKGSGFSPIRDVAEKDAKAWFRGCEASGEAPLCGWRHNPLWVIVH